MPPLPPCHDGKHGEADDDKECAHPDGDGFFSWSAKDIGGVDGRDGDGDHCHNHPCNSKLDPSFEYTIRNEKCENGCNEIAY